ncbi:MAG: tyrosine-type recombinase/integrase [Acidimicrobiales bacterium]
MLGHRRHTAAFNLIGTGIPLNQVQGILGHANISTTSLYIKARGSGRPSRPLPCPLPPLAQRN